MPPAAVRLTQLDVKQVHLDLQAVARLTLTAEHVPTLASIQYEDELGHGVQAFVQLEQDTFRLRNSSDPAGRSVIVLATPGGTTPPGCRVPARPGPARSRRGAALERRTLADWRGLTVVHAVYCRSM